jgi:hypothetical protein
MKTSFTIISLLFVLSFKGFSQESILTSSTGSVSILEMQKPENLFNSKDKLPLSMTRNFWGTRRFYEGDNEISNQEFAQKLSSKQSSRDLLLQSNKNIKYGNIATGVALIAVIGSYATIPKDSRYIGVFYGKPGWAITYVATVLVGGFLHYKGRENFDMALEAYNDRFTSNTLFDSNINGLTLSLKF